jgi:hypothetical protein
MCSRPKICCKDNRLAHALVAMQLFSYGLILTFRPTVNQLKSTSIQCRGPCEQESSEWCSNQCGRLVISVAEQSGIAVAENVTRFADFNKNRYVQSSTFFSVCYKIPLFAVYRISIFRKYFQLRSALDASQYILYNAKKEICCGKYISNFQHISCLRSSRLLACLRHKSLYSITELFQ